MIKLNSVLSISSRNFGSLLPKAAVNLNQSQDFNYGKNQISAKNKLKLDSINPNIVKMEYVVRGPLLARAHEIEKELKQVNIAMFLPALKGDRLHRAVE